MAIEPGDKVVLAGARVASEGLDDWRLLARTLRARFRTGDFAAGLALVDRIGEAAGAADHHPDVDLRYSHVDVTLVSHDVGGVTERDVRLAREISALAAEAGVSAGSSALQVVELGLDTPEREQVKPFWQAVLGYADTEPEELRDPGASWPTLWFQESDAHPTPHQRWHFDIWVDPAEVQPRIDAAVAAGGRLVSDEEAPSFWVLEDPQGNRACLCTWQERD